MAPPTLERRSEILAAARSVFGREGYARATLAQVAVEAAVSPATVSHYFGTKAMLFETMVEDAAEEFSARDALLVAEPGGYRDLLHRVVEEKWNQLNQEGVPQLTLTVLGEMRDFPTSARRLFRQLSERGRERLEAIIVAGETAGEFRVADPRCAAHVIDSLLVGAMLEQHFISECAGTTGCAEPARVLLLTTVDRIVGVST